MLKLLINSETFLHKKACLAITNTNYPYIRGLKRTIYTMC